MKYSKSAVPYYYELPEGFVVPSVYFPTPEVAPMGDTFSSYKFEFVWFVKFFHVNELQVYELAFDVLTAITTSRNLIPMIESDGAQANYGIRIKNPKLKKIDGTPSVLQLEISWKSSRPYTEIELLKIQGYKFTLIDKKMEE